MLLASGACLMYKRHRTLNFLDVLFDRMATLERSERTALDEEHEELLQEAQEKSASRETKVSLTPHGARASWIASPAMLARLALCSLPTPSSPALSRPSPRERRRCA